MCLLCESSQLGSGTDPALWAPMDTLCWGRDPRAAGVALQEGGEARLHHMKGARSIDPPHGPAEEPPVRLGVHLENVPTF